MDKLNETVRLDFLRFGCQQLSECRTVEQFIAVQKWFKRNIRL